MENDPQVIESSLLQIILFSGLAACIFGALGCQFIAMRHRSEDWLKFVHKDSMFKNKDLAYTPTGMKFIRAQKILAIVALGFGLALALSSKSS